MNNSKSIYNPQVFNSVSDFTNALGVPKPKHPMVAVFSNNDVSSDKLLKKFKSPFYMISLKTNFKGKVGYGQGIYDFDEGGMVFVAPNQILSVVEDADACMGINLVFHSDFIRNHHLNKSIHQYGFFSYNINEALHLSESEKQTILSVFKNIEEELKHNIDDFSQDILISQIESLLNYSQRFYKRQFITRKAVSHDLLVRVEQIIDEYLNNDRGLNEGLISVEYLASRINVSPRYLSDMLRSLTGQNAQQCIHEKLIGKAKEKLSTTGLSVSEIAYELGFEHPQSFNKLFKKKTNSTPLQFRASFN